MFIIVIVSLAMSILFLSVFGIMEPFPRWEFMMLSVIFTVVTLVALLHFKVDENQRNSTTAKNQKVNKDQVN